MAKFRQLKMELRTRLVAEGWREYLAGLGDFDEPQEYVSPLFALLPQAGLLHWRGITGLGLVVPALARKQLEAARVVLRRMLWHLNEESGNIGWGMGEGMGEILGHSPELAAEFNRVFFSYILDSGRDDNYIDYPPLLRGCFWGAGRLAQLRPDLAVKVLPCFIAGLGHEDAVVRGQAALSLYKALRAEPALRQGLSRDLLAEAAARLDKMRKDSTECEDYDGENILYPATGEAAARALDLLT